MGATGVFNGVNTIDDRRYEWDGEGVCASDDYDSLAIGNADGGTVMYGFGIVFDDVQVHKNATVSAAVLRVQVKRAIVAGSITGMSGLIYVNQADNAQSPASCFATSGAWTVSDDDWAANDNFDINLSTTEFNSLFARSGWSNGNSLAIYAYGDLTGDRIMWLKSIASFTPTLTLTFTNPAATIDSVQKTIADGDRDGESLEGGTLSHGGSTMYSGSNDPEDVGIVLIPQSVAIPVGTDADSIVVWMYANATNTSTAVKTKLFCEDAATSADLTDGTNFWARPVTTAWYDYTFPSITINTWYRIKWGPAPLNEVLDRGDWASGGNNLLWLNNDGTTGANKKGFEQLDEGGGHVAIITYFWHNVTASASTPARRRSVLQR